GPLSVQEDWIKHLQRHIMNASVPHTGAGMVEVTCLPKDPPSSPEPQTTPPPLTQPAVCQYFVHSSSVALGAHVTGAVFPLCLRTYAQICTTESVGTVSAGIIPPVWGCSVTRGCDALCGIWESRSSRAYSLGGPDEEEGCDEIAASCMRKEGEEREHRTSSSIQAGEVAVRRLIGGEDRGHVEVMEHAHEQLALIPPRPAPPSIQRPYSL
ncbi:hypothetical protein JZ751_013379, partial [Albula glossodonta]